MNKRVERLYHELKVAFQMLEVAIRLDSKDLFEKSTATQVATCKLCDAIEEISRRPNVAGFKIADTLANTGFFISFETKEDLVWGFMHQRDGRQWKIFGTMSSEEAKLTPVEDTEAFCANNKLRWDVIHQLAYLTEERDLCNVGAQSAIVP